MSDIQLTDKERDVMLHALGLPSHGNKMRRWAYRNRFVTNANTVDFPIWEQLQENGYAIGKKYHDAPDWTYFLVTLEGVQALGDNILRRIPRELRIIS